MFTLSVVKNDPLTMFFFLITAEADRTHQRTTHGKCFFN